MTDCKMSDVLVFDTWGLLKNELREQLTAARRASITTVALDARDPNIAHWEPLRPLTLRQQSYRNLESTLSRLLQLAVEACQRRAATAGELHRALRFPYKLPLMDPDRPLRTHELTRFARPDILIERGTPRLLEFNNCPRLGGVTITPRLADSFAQLCPWSGLRAPLSAVAARSAALVRTLGGHVGPSNPRRLLIPTYWALDATDAARHHSKVKKAIVADARRVGFDVVQSDLSDLHLDCTGRLRAANEVVDIVLINWGSDTRIVNDNGGMAALRRADRLGTVELFPRSESDLISSKAVLAWLHEDCAAGELDSADQALVLTHVPYTTCIGLSADGDARRDGLRATDRERDHMVAKPAVGKSGNGVIFGSRAGARDWRCGTVQAAEHAPVVLQDRVESDRITMPFVDRSSGHQTTLRVPAVISPFLIDNAAASVAVRHPNPDIVGSDVVISASRGACPNTTLLTELGD